MFGSNGIVGTHNVSNTKSPLIVIGRKGSYGKLTFSEEPGFAIDTTYFVDQTQTQNNLRWLYYAMSCLELDSYSKDSAVPGLSREEAYEKITPHPPIEEQRSIARFLDHKTAQIDALITKKETLLKKLAEKRTALISQAITKGCDRTVPTKDSGVEWMGEIPAHWKTMVVKRTARNGYKTFTDGDWIETPYITDEGVRLIQTGNIGIGEYIEKGFRYVSEETFTSLKCTEVFPNDVLICRLDGPVGRACLAPDLGTRMITSVDNAILKPSEDFDPRFIVYSLSSDLWFDWIQALCRVGGGFRFRISRSILGDLRITAPSVEEQREIADYIDSQLSKINSTATEIRAAIAKLKEYRTALITNAVTGKIDVRDVILETEPMEAA